MFAAIHDRGQKPGDQRDEGVFRLGEILPQVLARAGVTQQPLRKEVMTARPSRMAPASPRLGDGNRELVTT